MPKIKQPAPEPMDKGDDPKNKKSDLIDQQKREDVSLEDPKMDDIEVYEP